MKKISGTTELSSVKILVSVSSVLLFFFSQDGSAERNSATRRAQQDPPRAAGAAATNPGAAANPPAGGGAGTTAATAPGSSPSPGGTPAVGVSIPLTTEYNQLQRDNANAERCRVAGDRIAEDNRRIAEACRKAGLGGGESCASRVRSCSGAASDGSADTMAAFNAAIGAAGGAGASAAGCPQMAGRDYFTEKSRLEKEIKDTEKEIAELNDDKAKVQDDYNKDIAKIQEDLTKAQEDYKKKELQIAESERQKIADFQTSQNQARENMRKIGAEVLTLRGQLISSQRDRALRMIAMSEASGKRSCMKAVTDARAAYVSAAGGTNIKTANQRKQELIRIYNDCMSAYDQQRIALTESKRQEQEEITNRINNAQSNLDEIQNGLNLAASQLQEVKDAATKEKNDALQSVIDLGTRSQTAMQAAYTKLQENLRTIAAKSTSLTAALNRSNTALAALGPVPPRGSEITAAEAGGEINAANENIQRTLRQNPECRGLDPASSESSSRGAATNR